MARVVKPANIRQDEILDVAQRLFLQRGYEDTPIQAIIDEVGIAKGTFYHHYPSKPALLDALVARMAAQALDVVRPLVEDPTVDAITKLNAVFLRIGAWKADRRDVLVAMHRALHAPANAMLLARMQRDSTDAIVPLVAAVVEQGRAEGVFDTRFPLQAARHILDLGITLGRVLGDALVGTGTPPDPAALLTDVDAFHDAVGRLLGAPPGAVRLVDPDVIARWWPAPPPPPRSNA